MARLLMKLRAILKKLSCRSVADCDGEGAVPYDYNDRPTPVRLSESEGRLRAGEWESFDLRAARALSEMGAKHGVALRKKGEARAGVQSVFFS